MSLALSSLFGTLPDSLRDELFKEFNDILRNYRESRWEPAELDGGKLCEVVYTILLGMSEGHYRAKAFKPNKFYDSCKEFEKLDKTKFSQSVRITVPRLLIALYEIRNNRGVGHVGGDVNPNHMDATLVVASAKWLISELIRIFHKVDTDTAANAIDLIIERETAAVWNADNDIKRVLLPGLDFKAKTLLLLYSCINGTASADQLFNWTEYSRKTTFKTNVLKKCHDERLLEYNESAGTAKISPLGIRFIEDEILTDK